MKKSGNIFQCKSTNTNEIYFFLSYFVWKGSIPQKRYIFLKFNDETMKTRKCFCNFYISKQCLVCRNYFNFSWNHIQIIHFRNWPFHYRYGSGLISHKLRSPVSIKINSSKERSWLSQSHTHTGTHTLAHIQGHLPNYACVHETNNKNNDPQFHCLFIGYRCVFASKAI